MSRKQSVDEQSQYAVHTVLEMLRIINMAKSLTKINFCNTIARLAVTKKVKNNNNNNNSKFLIIPRSIPPKHPPVSRVRYKT
jgi:hypothetical protein